MVILEEHSKILELMIYDNSIRELIKRTNIDPNKIDDVILGCANQAGEDNRNVARMASLLAGIPYAVPGETVNSFVLQACQQLFMLIDLLFLKTVIYLYRRSRKYD